MNDCRRTVRVVAAVITDGERIFATQRGYGEFKDYWEFPGGKIERCETPKNALEREIREELDTQIDIGEYIGAVEYDYPSFRLHMDCYLASVRSGSLVLKEHEAARWLDISSLGSVEWLPADYELLPRIKDKLLLEKAKRLAREQFAGITDKSGVDYFEGHLCSVAGRMASDKEKTVAFLHDIIEDRQYPEEALRSEFGDEITDAVKRLTHGPGLGEEEYLECIRKLKESGDRLAIAVKISDLTNNSDYTRLGARSAEELSEKDRKRYEKYQKALEILKDDRQ